MSQENNTAEAVQEQVTDNVEQVDAEVGSGEIEQQVQEESSLEQPMSAEEAQQVDELAEQVEEAIEAGASEEEIKEMVEVFKIKAYGEEKEVKLDWNDKDSIRKKLEMAEAAPQAMQKAAELEKTFRRELERLKNDPWEILQELGHDPDELAEARIQKQIEQLQKSPEQLAQEERDRELAELRQKLKEQQEEKQKIEFEQMQRQAEIDLEREITEAISATKELPKSPYVMKRVADAMAWAMDNGRPDIKPSEVLPIVEKEMHQELNQFLEEMPDKVLEKWMSKNITDRLRKQRLAKIPSQPKVVDTGKKVQSEDKKLKKQTLNDFLKNGFKE